MHVHTQMHMCTCAHTVDTRARTCSAYDNSQLPNIFQPIILVFVQSNSIDPTHIPCIFNGKVIMIIKCSVAAINIHKH